MKRLLRRIGILVKHLFSDTNSINEKSIVGFLAFVMMIFTLILDMVTGLMGREFPIHEFVYDGFLYICIGALGIASVDKIFRRSGPTNDNFDIDDEFDMEDDHTNECHCDMPPKKCHCHNHN